MHIDFFKYPVKLKKNPVKYSAKYLFSLKLKANIDFQITDMIEQISIPLLMFSINKSKAINFPNILIPFKKVRQFDDLIHSKYSE